jgi:hypothetical protein
LIFSIISWIDAYIYDHVNIQSISIDAVSKIMTIKQLLQEVHRICPQNSLPLVEGRLEFLMFDEASRRHKHACAKKIQQMWRLCVSNPNHPICCRRLAYEFSNMNNNIM